MGLGVAAWSPLAGGVLSGKYGRPAGATGPTRLDPASLDERAHAVAQAVWDVSDERGATPSQVAIAWTMARSRSVHPILGARRVDQLRDNLGALDIRLTPEECRRLEAATGFTLGFPGDFIAQTSSWVFGAALVEPPTVRDGASDR
jgi:aryl-alcohol dehydrogenase-like predicted oxidoreductase